MIKWYMLHSHLTTRHLNETDIEQSHFNNYVSFVKGENNIRNIKNKMLKDITRTLEIYDETDITSSIMYGFHVSEISENIIVRYNGDDEPEYFAMVCMENHDNILFENVYSDEYKDFIENKGENLKILNGDLSLSPYNNNKNTVRLYKYKEEQ